MARPTTPPVHENVSEATAACLFAMVQGNLVLLSLSHLAIALQTGVVAGLAASALLALSSRWTVRVPAWLVLGVLTTAVDAAVHPGMIGPVFLEAVLTGMMAAALSWGFGRLRRARRERAERARAHPEGVSRAARTP